MGMTTLLYYDDSYCTHFAAEVTAVAELEGHPALQLAQTHFYPTSGGQPHDTGRLAGAPVVDVRAQDGGVWHLLAKDAAGHQAAQPQMVGRQVEGSIDWPRRYDHMQQHSGQHLLSQVFYRLYGAETVSVHFGALESTLDLDGETLEAEQLAAAEQEANRLAYQALPISAYQVNQEALSAIPLRRPPTVSGLVRIVEIAGYDYSACGGTHVHTTAELAPVKVLRQERRRGQSRLTFVCGLRACADYAARHALLAEAAVLFSNEAAAVPGLIRRSLEQNRDLQRQVETLAEQLAHYEIDELLADAATVVDPGADPAGDLRVVQKLYADRSVDDLKRTAALLRSRPQTLALLATQAGGKLTLLFGRSEDGSIHCGNLLRATLQAFGGSGGGRPDLAQGGGVDPSAADAILAHARKLATQPDPS